MQSFNAFNKSADKLSKAYKQLNKEMLLPQTEETTRENLIDDEFPDYITMLIKVMGDIVMNIVHRMRSPLGAIQLFAELLQQDIDDDKHDMVQDILASVYSLDAILSNLLSAVQPINPRMTKLNIVSIVEESLNVASSAIKQQGIVLTKEFSNKQIYCNGDTEQLKQVYFNVILNAIQAMPDGGTLLVCISKSDDNKFIETEITDSGYGIPENLMDRVFTPFFTTKEGGTGLGLYVAYRIIQAHNGKIKVHSVYGIKTNVFIKIPINPSES